MKPNLKDTAAQSIRRKVLTLALVPGEPLDEVQLSEQYDLSRTPLREVLQRLAGEGYIELEANRGAYVTSMDLANVRSFFQSAPMIYAAIARLAAEQASTEQLTQLKKIQGRFTRAVEKSAAVDMAVLNHQFHEQIGHMANSPYLTPSLGRLLIDHTRMCRSFYQPDKARTRRRVIKACKQHDKIITAIEQNDPELSVELTIAHWELSRSDMDSYVMPDSLPIDDADQMILMH
jgi:DNA-binding GntR family transcriptional regulator